MGFFTPTADSKTELIRLLLIERIKNDPEAQAHGYSASSVRALSMVQVTGSIEASIVYMVETIDGLILKGHSEEEAIILTERHRSGLGRGQLPSPLDIANFIQYRVDIEYSGAPLPSGHVEFCKAAATHFFTFKDDVGSAANSVKYVQLEDTTKKLEWIYGHLANLADSKITEDEFYETVWEEVFIWADKFKERKEKADVFRLKSILRNA